MQFQLKNATNFQFTVPERMQVSGFNICTRFETLPRAAMVRLTLSGVVYDGSDVHGASAPTSLIYMQEMYDLEGTPFSSVPENRRAGLAAVDIRSILDALPDVHPQHGVIAVNADMLAIQYDAEFAVDNGNGEHATSVGKEYAAPLEITYARWLPEDKGEDTETIVFSPVGIINVPLPVWVAAIEQSVVAAEDTKYMLSVLTQAIGRLLGGDKLSGVMPLPATIVGKFCLSEELFTGGFDELLRQPAGTALGHACVGMMRVIPPVPQIAPMISEVLYEVMSTMDGWREKGAGVYGTYVDHERLAKYRSDIREDTYVTTCAEFIRTTREKGELASEEEKEDATILRRKTAFVLRSLPKMLNHVIDDVCVEHPRTPAEDDNDAKAEGPGKVVHAEAVSAETRDDLPEDMDGWTSFEPLTGNRDTADGTGDDNIDDFLRSLIE